jgi:hypothetical protein
MRTKTLLIAAATALAAGIVSSQAQVYSQNVVGYVNTVTPNGGTYLITVPFSIGVSNGANEIYPLISGTPGNNAVPSLPDYSQVLIWTGNNYTAYNSDSTSPSLWDDANFANLPGAPVLPVGQGFFLIPSASYTNTFVGTVAVAAGATNNTVYVNGGTYLVASDVPYGGYVTNGTSTGGGLALDINNGLPDYSQILVWTGNNYTAYNSDSGSPSLWDDSNFANLATPPSINVGQGFFLIPSANFTWTVGLSNQ